MRDKLLAPRWLPQVEGSDVLQHQVSLSKDDKVEYRPVGLQERQEGGKVNNGAVHNSRLLTSPGPAHTTSNFAPNEYRGVVNSSGLAVYKGSTQVIIVVVLKVNAKSKLRL